MKNIRTKHVMLTACLVAVNLLPLAGSAQEKSRSSYAGNSQLKNYGSSNSNTSPAIDPGGNPDVPIDGGISLLVAAGVAIGVKKVQEKRTKNE